MTVLLKITVILEQLMLSLLVIKGLQLISRLTSDRAQVSCS